MTIRDQILECMADAGYTVDVPITAIYTCVYGSGTTPLRRQQQRLGARFSVINKEFADGKHSYGRIVPGDMKRTYRLVRA